MGVTTPFFFVEDDSTRLTIKAELLFGHFDGCLESLGIDVNTLGRVQAERE